jgi:uroporphyrinogen-III synthase
MDGRCVMVTAKPLLIVTRPEPDATAWADALAQQNWPAVALPLIAIRPTRHPDTLAAAWAQIGSYQAVMFVSANAVAHFFNAASAHLEGTGALNPASWRAWATGPGTTQALWRAGMDAGRIDAPDAQSVQLDSEALWQRVQGQLASLRRVLIVRGSDAQGAMAGRDWLAQQLQAQGVSVDFVVAYERDMPCWTAAQRAHALASTDAAAVWVFSSSEAIANLQQWLPHQVWTHARAVATHPRIAQAARNAGFGVVCESRPGLDAVLASIKSM